MLFNGIAVDRSKAGLADADWEYEEVFCDSEDFFRSQIEGIKRARETIRFETYIFENDRCGQEMIQHLCDAARRGIRVQVLVDGLGTPEWKNTIFPPLTEAGALTRVYHPPPWALFSFSWDIRKLPLFFTRFLHGINRRNHRKVCVVDGECAWLGSMNVSESHRPSMSDQAWRDVGIEVRGEEVKILSDAFDSTWALAFEAGQKRLPRLFKKGWKNSFDRARLVRLNHFRVLRRRKMWDLLRRLRNARERVWITTPYFIPTRSVLRGLRLASKRGVDVRVILSRKNDHELMAWASWEFYYSLLKNNVRIFEYLPRFHHAKVLLIDDWATVGTTNINHRSIIHDLEVDVVVTKKENHRILMEQLEQDIEESAEITLKECRDKPLLERLAGKCALFFHYWL